MSITTTCRAVLTTTVVIGALVAASPVSAAQPRPVAPTGAGDISVRTAPDCHGGYSPDGGALVCFVPYGEHLWICDTAADGRRPGATYRINGGAWTTRHYDLRHGNCHDLDLDIAESGYIEFIPRNYAGSTLVSSGSTYRVSAQG